MFAFRSGRRLAAVLIPLALSAPLAIAAPVLDGEAGGFSSYRLDNGFRIILVPFPEAATARVELLVRSGSKREGYGETGMAHLLEHMLFKQAGTQGDLKQALTALGARWNGTTNADRTNYFSTVVGEPDKVDALIRIEADRFIRPAFTAADLAREMSVVRNELERKDNDPASLARRPLLRQSFFWHGYGRPTIGARSDIEQAPFAALQAFHRRHYRPDNAALIVSGKFDADRVLALSGQLFGKAKNPPTPALADRTRDEPAHGPQRSEIHRDSGQSMALVGWRLPGMSNRQTVLLTLGSRALCTDSWGRLRKTLVDERQLALGAACGIQTQTDYSLLIASAGAGPDGDPAALADALAETVDGFARRGLSAEQLARARRAELDAYARRGESHEALAGQLSDAETAGDWRLYFRARDIVATATLDEVNAALVRWLADTYRNEVLLRNLSPRRVEAPAPAAAPAELLAGGQWPPLAREADPLPASFAELAAQSVAVDLGDPSASAQLLPGRRRGGRAWLLLANDYGNPDTLRGRGAACSLAGALLAQGSPERDRNRLAAALERLQAKTSFGLGQLRIEAPEANLAAALDLLLAVRRAPALPEKEFVRLRAAALAELEATRRHPGQLAANAAALRFDNYPADHPARPRPLAERIAELHAVTYADVRRCVADFGGRSRIRLAVIGNFDEDAVRGFWRQIATLPAAPHAYRRIDPPAAPDRVDGSPIVVALPAKPNADVFGIAQLPLRLTDADYPALMLAVRLLGGDNDSRIRQRLREREGLAYSAGASLSASPFVARGTVSISASAASPQAERARELLREELARALADGFSEAEVARAKAAWKNGRQLALTAESTIAGHLLQAQRSGLDARWEAGLEHRVGELDAAAVNAALRKFLAPVTVVWGIGKGE